MQKEKLALLKIKIAKWCTFNAVGMLVFFVVLNLLFWLMSITIVTSNISNLFTISPIYIDGSDFTFIADLFVEIYVLVSTVVGVIALAIVATLIMLISTFLFGRIYFKKPKFPKEYYFAELRMAKNIILVLFPLFTLIFYHSMPTVLLITGIIFFLIFTLVSYFILKRKIVKSFRTKDFQDEINEIANSGK